MEILKSIVILYQAMSMLKLKITVNLPQLLSIVVHVERGECKTHQIAQIRYFEPQKRQYSIVEVV